MRAPTRRASVGIVRNGFVLSRLSVAVGGTGPTVVLLHGWPQTGRAWRRVLPALARDHTVVVPDLRGTGASERPDSGYAKTDQADDMRGVLTELGLRRGRGRRPRHRRHGRFAWAAAHPDDVAALALTDGAENRRLLSAGPLRTPVLVVGAGAHGATDPAAALRLHATDVTGASRRPGTSSRKRLRNGSSPSCAGSSPIIKGRKNCECSTKSSGLPTETPRATFSARSVVNSSWGEARSFGVSSPCGRAPMAQSRDDRPRADSRLDYLHRAARP